MINEKQKRIKIKSTADGLLELSIFDRIRKTSNVLNSHVERQIQFNIKFFATKEIISFDADD